MTLTQSFTTAEACLFAWIFCRMDRASTAMQAACRSVMRWPFRLQISHKLGPNKSMICTSPFFRPASVFERTACLWCVSINGHGLCIDCMPIKPWTWCFAPRLLLSKGIFMVIRGNTGPQAANERLVNKYSRKLPPPNQCQWVCRCCYAPSYVGCMDLCKLVLDAASIGGSAASGNIWVRKMHRLRCCAVEPAMRPISPSTYLDVLCAAHSSEFGRSSTTFLTITKKSPC